MPEGRLTSCYSFHPPLQNYLGHRAGIEIKPCLEISLEEIHQISGN